MKLSELNEYQDIVIQCHDNPDPDTIGAGYALYYYFKERGRKVRLIYSGHLTITKPNVRLIVEELDIPLEYVKTVEIPQLLITVDCQYGASNVTHFEAPEVVVVDHHEQEIKDLDRKRIQVGLASACTVVWNMLMEQGVDVNRWPNVATALYYGLFTDSAGFSEVRHPLDKDMRDELKVDEALIRRLKNAVLTLSELEIAGMALIRHSYNLRNRFVVVKAKECDPNILGFISDLAIQVDSVNVCLVYNETIHGIKFSVRSCVKEVMANELASYLCQNIGSGGGHIDKAGGFINVRDFNRNNAHLNADEFFLRRLTKYYKSFDVIDALEYSLNKEDFMLYRKNPVVLGMVPLCDITLVGSTLCIRTIEGDINVQVEEGLYLLIGKKGEIRPIDKEKFQRNYKKIDGLCELEFNYFPTIRNKGGQVTLRLKDYIYSCVAEGNSYFYAKPLVKSVKLFPWWDRLRYIYGKPQDYLIISQEDNKDMDIIDKKTFLQTYSKVV